MDPVVNNNGDSQLFETPRKNNFSSYCFGDTIATATTPSLSTLPPPEIYICFKTEGRTVWSSQCAESRALIKVLKSIFEIESFERKVVIIKKLLQSKQLKKIWSPLGLTNN